MDRPTRRSAVLLAFALSTFAALPAAGQTCNSGTGTPCQDCCCDGGVIGVTCCKPVDNCSGGTALTVVAQAPFPDTGDEWRHVAGSQAHCTPDIGWYADCWALDLNYNPTTVTPAPSNLDYLMPVLATADGTVDTVVYDDPSGYGNIVRIDHDGQYRSLYAHMDPILMITPFQRVRAGQVLGFISNSGGVGAHHLHFALRTTSNNTGAHTRLQGNPDPNGNNMVNAASSMPVLSNSNQYFLEDFRAQNTGWSFTPSSGIALLPAGDLVRTFRHYLHVRSGKGPYLLEHAVQFNPYVTSGIVQAQLHAYSFGSHPDRTGFTPARAFLGTLGSAAAATTNQGWEAASYVFNHSSLPAGTRFVRPAIATLGNYQGGAKLDWLRFVELAPTASSAGGNVRVNGFNRGGANRVQWSLSSTAGVNQLRVLRANSELSPYAPVATLGSTATVFTDKTISPGATYFYMLEIRNTAGVLRTVGPVGPLDSAIRHQIPGFGDTRIVSDMRDIPDWAGYPALSFDGNNDTYGLINYNASQVRFTFNPVSAPRTLKKIRAYFGGNTNNWGGSLVQYGTNTTITLPSATNTSLQWSEIAIPAVPIQSITLWFQRTNGDRFFHNAELQFVP